ncbi:MAG: SoxY-related AACIE arm protein [Burkholderiaceae bacterium]|nr:SoxY-related AACIE arm protein [Burkholderiaceae bacterium]
MTLSRRHVVAAGFGVGAGIVWCPAQALSDELAGALRSFTGGARTQEGRVVFDIAPLVENGNTVPVTITVQSPMSAADHVQAIAVFNEKNPQREVIACKLTPAMGKAVVSTRIRLATTQQLVAVAKMSDGSFWTHTVDVIVTLAACIE